MACYTPGVAKEIQIEVMGLKLAARSFGDDKGRPVLALHGWLDNAASFDRLAPLLPQSLHVVALDLPGHGLSDHRSADASYQFVEWVAFVFGAADALGWKRFSLLGHSLGAAISAIAAGTFPGRIERAVLLEAIGPLTTPVDDAPTQLATAIKARANVGRIRARVYKDLSEATRIRSEFSQAPVSSAGARLLVERGTRPVEGGFVWRYDERLRQSSLMRMSEEQLHPFLKRASCPLLVVLARQSWPMPQHILKARLACIPHAQVITRAGRHHFHLEQPEVMAEDVAGFLTANP